MMPPKRTSEFNLICIDASIYQAATLHKTLSHKFRLEIEDSVVRKLKERADREKIAMKKEASLVKKQQQ